MSTNRINIQAPTQIAGVISQAVRFKSGPFELAGTLYTPDRRGPFPGVIVTGAWTTVKEQMPGTYARELAKRGYAALAFDFTGWGGSEGDRRYIEDPATKTADIRAAAAFMEASPMVAGTPLSGLGICASSGYMLQAVADDPLFGHLALVAPWLHDEAMAQGIYGGAEAAAGLIALSDQAEGAPSSQVLVAASATDDKSLMYQAPHYTETDRGLIDAYDNQFDLRSWRPWLTYNAFAAVRRLSAPTLVVCSEAAALPAGAHRFADEAQVPVDQIWLEDVNQFDFYYRADVVEQVSNAVSAHFSA